MTQDRHSLTARHMPVRIQRKATKGWQMPPNTRYVGRPNKWGSSFHVTPDCPPEMSVLNFAIMLDKHDRAEIKETLRGFNLCCWDSLDQPCHVDVLLKIANDQEPFEEAWRKISAALRANPKSEDLTNLIKEFGALIKP